jgi:hypothetical protein
MLDNLPLRLIYSVNALKIAVSPVKLAKVWINGELRKVFSNVPIALEDEVSDVKRTVLVVSRTALIIKNEQWI